MIATSVAYDIVFLVHILSAIGTVIVLVTMRISALSVARSVKDSVQRARFPNRRNWAARIVHILPITGLVMSLSGNSSVALSRPWIGVGLFCYVAAAGHLEARTLPQERVISESIAKEGVASVESGRKLVRSIDVLLGLIAVAMISMLIQY